MLRPGGRFAVSDVVADEDMDEATRSDMENWTGCIAGALTRADYRASSPRPASRRSRSRRPIASTSTRRRRSSAPGLPSGVTQAEIQLFDPQTLYRRWEDSQWNPFEIDLERDKEQWAELAGEDRDLIYWVLAQLMVAEERITTKFSGLVGAYGDESEATFLSTQQVDEARHMQFYARFQDEVVDSPATVSAHVERARREVTPAFRKLFDEALVEAHEKLVAAPQDLAAKVRFVTIYHLILESTLGLTTFRFATEYLKREELAPGLRRRLLPYPPRRDAPHRLRRLVPARERPRSA